MATQTAIALDPAFDFIDKHDICPFKPKLYIML